MSSSANFSGLQSSTSKRGIPALGKKRLTRLTPADLNHLYIGLLNEKGLAPRYVRLIHAVLHRAFRQGERWGLIVRNPADLLDAPRVPRKEAKYLRTPQIEALFEAARGELNEALYVLALTTGLRQGELLGLRRSDVDVEKRTLQVRQQVQRARGGWVFSEPKTASGRRLVVLPRMAANALKAHRRRQAELRLRVGPAFEDLDLVFPNALGRPLERQNLLRRSFKPLLAKAGLPDIPFHGLRHSAATLLLSEGVHQRIVQERLGHSSSVITQDLYSHVAPSLQAEAADQIDRLFAVS